MNICVISPQAADGGKVAAKERGLVREGGGMGFHPRCSGMGFPSPLVLWDGVGVMLELLQHLSAPLPSGWP